MNEPQPVPTKFLQLSDNVKEECRLAAIPDRTEAQEARLRVLQTANALSKAGQDENPPRKTYRINPHDA